MPGSDYKVICEIGSGSYGHCYLVQQQSAGGYNGGGSPRRKERRLAMKEIDLSGRDSQQRASAEMEVKVLSSLKHPYIVRYWESFMQDTYLCIVMDYCEGGDLWQHIQRCKKKCLTIPESQVVRWFTQMCLALKYMHEKAVLHRDIKTQNIFLTKREEGGFGCVRIADFGISKVLGEGAHAFARTLVGTPYYLSPEMCLKQPYACPSDVWALGCVLYEMCALKVPFEAQELAQLVQRICQGPLPRFPPTYSRELCDMGSELLVREASKRPTAAAVLQKTLCQAEIKRMLLDNQREGRDSHREKENRFCGGAEDVCCRAEKRRDSYRDGSRPPEGDRGRGQRRPLAELNSAREPSKQRAPSKQSSRAPSPHKGVALEVLRPSRASSPARGLP